MNPTNPGNSLNDVITPTPHGRPPVQSRVERLTGLLIVLSACTLETLPITCWLLMSAAYDTGDPNDAAMPFWWTWLLVVGVYGLGALFLHGTDADPRRRRLNTALLTIAIVVLGPLSLLITYWLSPAAQRFLADGSDSGGPVMLALLVAWLWWRGLLLSRGRVVRERIYIRFLVALGVTVAALAGAAAIPGAARALTASYLALLLALLLFVGTMGLTLAQARDASDEMRNAYRGRQPLEAPPVFTRSWLASGLGLSLGLSLVALLLATLISRDSVRILAVAAGNIYNGLVNAVQVALSPLFWLIALILNGPITWMANLLHKWQPSAQRTTPPPTCPATSGTSVPSNPCLPPTQNPTGSLFSAEWLTAIHWGTAILIVVVALVILTRILSHLSDLRRVRAFTEERMMLDAGEILGGQLRRFLDAFRRKRHEDIAVADDLVAGSIRQVYRDTLATAAISGHARRVAETPREYQRRIITDDPQHPDMTPPTEVAGALAELTDAYEHARYGQPDTNTSPPASPEAVRAAEAVQRWLKRK